MRIRRSALVEVLLIGPTFLLIDGLYVAIGYLSALTFKGHSDILNGLALFAFVAIGYVVSRTARDELRNGLHQRLVATGMLIEFLLFSGVGIWLSKSGDRPPFDDLKASLLTICTMLTATAMRCSEWVVHVQRSKAVFLIDLNLGWLNSLNAVVSAAIGGAIAYFTANEAFRSETAALLAAALFATTCGFSQLTRSKK